MRVATLLLVLVTLAATAGAQEETFIWFYSSGDGDFMDSPPVFTGGMDPGGDIVNGSWSITVCDHGWPTDPTERNAYIWDTFFAGNYTPGPPGFWTGVIDFDHGQPHMNRIAIVDDDNGGMLGGICSVQYQVQDLNGNAELDDGEFCSGSLGGLIVVLRHQEGSGYWDDWGGTGNYFGAFSRDCPTTSDSWQFGMYLWLDWGS